MSEDFPQNVPNESLEQMKSRLREIEFALQTAKQLGEKDEINELESEIATLKERIKNSPPIHLEDIDNQDSEQEPYSEAITLPPVDPQEELKKLKDLFKN